MTDAIYTYIIYEEINLWIIKSTQILRGEDFVCHWMRDGSRIGIILDDTIKKYDTINDGAVIYLISI